jgi:bifunctional non-homologous end joining protein LigD
LDCIFANYACFGVVTVLRDSEKQTQPMITPMVARLVKEPFNREGWLFELKWDGFRGIAEKDKLGVRLYSRNHNDFTKRFPVIAHAVKALDNVILDGEIVALDEQGHPRFEWLVNRGP